MNRSSAVSAGRSRVLVAALGNPERGDDSFGVLVGRELIDRFPDDVTVLECTGDVLSLLDVWSGYEVLICVDACDSMGAPGRVHRFDLTTQALPTGLGLASTHVFGLAEMIELGRALALSPKRIVVYAVEGASFALGTAATEEIVAAAARVVDCVVLDVEGLR